MKTPNATRPTQCPFCKTSNYAVEYRGVKKKEKGMEQLNNELIEAKIRMRQQELQDEEDRVLKQREISSSSIMRAPTEVDYYSTRVLVGKLRQLLGLKSKGHFRVASHILTIDQSKRLHRMVPAAVTCKDDAAALCITYDRGIHSANPLACRHERSAVVPFYDTAESMGPTQKGLIDISMGVKTHLSEQLMKQFLPIMHQRRIGKQPKQWEFSIEFSIGRGGPGFQVFLIHNFLMFIPCSIVGMLDPRILWRQFP
ncbi:hypothetical protein ACS0TY_031269 [Phlomoides rotata]